MNQVALGGELGQPNDKSAARRRLLIEEMVEIIGTMVSILEKIVSDDEDNEDNVDIEEMVEIIGTMVSILEEIVADDEDNEDNDEGVDEVTDRTFGNEVLARAGPVLVDFWARGCPPCRRMTPILKEIAVELGDRLRIVKINIDENPETAERYRIESIPAMVVYVNGQEVEKIVGARSKAKLLRELSPWIR
ncbi:hypothetical protein FDG2_1408 [Candidatus Protofrankia californiensis]|uniref:Thioredoxin n=1 Tax=Candidatus Protofrankia californiensis TaxID=1839754 RepID=A0A1C3NVL6_9ACTN|nr:hypothetical protein FDG2_1408 [Candidatus Protofrankia californiensis]